MKLNTLPLKRGEKKRSAYGEISSKVKLLTEVVKVSIYKENLITPTCPSPSKGEGTYRSLLKFSTKNIRRSKMKRIFTAVMAVIFIGCGPATVGHDEEKAVTDANAVLKILYFSNDIKGAYGKFDDGFKKSYTADDLKKIIDDMKNKETGYGKLKELKADSFYPLPSKKIITIYYDGNNEKAPSYHQVVMFGDINGYKIYGLYITDKPFPENKYRQKFKKDFFLKQ